MKKQILNEQVNPDIPKLKKAITLGCLPLKGSEDLKSKQPANPLVNTSEGRVGFKFINKYDIVIYGSYHRGMPFYDLVNQIYKSNEVILLCGEDIHNCDNYEWVVKGHNVFVREL